MCNVTFFPNVEYNNSIHLYSKINTAITIALDTTTFLMDFHKHVKDLNSISAVFMRHQSITRNRCEKILLINHVYVLAKSINAKNNEKRFIDIYCGNGENINCGETYAWYQHFQRKSRLALRYMSSLQKQLT